MPKKRQLPIELLKIIEPIIEENQELITIKKDSLAYYEFIDKHPDSNFYFKIGGISIYKARYIIMFTCNHVRYLMSIVQKPYLNR